MPKVKLHSSFLPYLIFFSLNGYLQIITIIYTLLILHECSHFILCKLFKVHVNSITFSPLGLIMSTNYLEQIQIYKRIIIYMSGPLFHIFALFLIIHPWFQFLSPLWLSTNLILLFINILPIYPLDGANILESLLRLFFRHLTSLKITLLISLLTLIMLFMFLSSFQNFSYMLIIVILFLFHIRRFKHLDNYVLYEIYYSQNKTKL